MNNFRNKLSKLMQDRYGVDELYKFLFLICFIFVIIDMFINSYILVLIETLLLVIIFYRVLSKNKYKRSKENKKYLDIKNKTISKFNYFKKRYKDRNTHTYKKCPNCKQKIRLPLKKGKHIVKCPNCNNRFEVKCHRNEKVKVEIVK